MAAKIDHPRADGGIQFALKCGGERDQFARAGRAAGRHESRDGLARQHGLLAAHDACDPRLQRLVIHDRHAFAEFRVAADFAETVSATIPAFRVVAEKASQDLALASFRVMECAVEAQPRRNARGEPRAIGDRGLHRATIRRPAGVRFASLISVMQASSSPAAWPGFRARKNATCSSDDRPAGVSPSEPRSLCG